MVSAKGGQGPGAYIFFDRAYSKTVLRDHGMVQSGVRLPIGPLEVMLKKIFIPGWMDTADNRVDFKGWEIWKNKIDPGEKIDAEYVIGHSLGANFALINWERNKNTKLILIGPLVPKRNIFSWFFRWIEFLFGEGTSISKKRLATFSHFISGAIQCFLLLSKNLMQIIDAVPKDSLVIIRGKSDKYFFCEDTANRLREKGVRIVEVEDAGHGWNDQFNNVINNLTK